ncbi:MAG: CvpA family protein [Oscillospiraceae bacterium]|nr:CvpA family protein [Oscillospiraceae bacterium]
MAYIVDILMVLLFGALIIASVKKGFFASLFDLVGTLISVITARLLSDAFAPKAFDTFIRGGAESYLTNALGEVGTKDYAAQAMAAIDSIPDSLNGIMSLMGVDKQMITEKIASAQGSGGNLIDTLMTNVVEPVGTAVARFVLFVLLCVVVGFVLKIVIRLLNSIIKKLPAVKQLNGVLGAVFGVLRGLIVVVIVSMLIALLASVVKNEAFISAVNSSVIISTVRNFISTVSGITV